MKTVTATDAKNRFGDLLEESASGPVRIDRNGRPVAYVVSADDYDILKDLLGLTRVKRLVAEGHKGVVNVLKGFSSGNITRHAAMASLGLQNYSQLLQSLRAAGFEPPALPRAQRRKMADGFLKILHG